MIDTEINYAICAAVFFVAALIVGVVVFNSTQSHWEREAVSVGHAEYYLDKDHKRQWRWKKLGD